MHVTKQIAKHFKEVYFGGNWTWSTLKEQLEGVTWEQATTKVGSLNTILALVYHIQYFVRACTMVLEGKPLDAHDKYSFDHPEIKSREEWEAFLAQVFKEAEHYASLVEAFPDERLYDVFVQEKYGNFFRNFLGLIEHTHYHLGQIAIIKKLVAEQQ